MNMQQSHYTTNAAEAIDRYNQRHNQPPFNPRAALVDMDGTLLDSMSGHTLAWHRLATELGITATREEFYLYEGMTGANTINKLFQRAFHRDATDREKSELYARKTVYFNELPRVGVIPDAGKVMQMLADAGLKRVLVTGSGQLSNLERLNHDFPGIFADDMRITARNVTHGKPHPEPYLKAMEMAAVHPHEAIVIENAPLGVEAGVRSGALTVAVTTGPIPAEAMWEAGADMVLPSMTAFAALLPALLERK